MSKPRVFQIHALRDGELVTMVQREYPEPYTTAAMQTIASEAKTSCVDLANEKGGCDELVLHEEDSDGFLWTWR